MPSADTGGLQEIGSRFLARAIWPSLPQSRRELGEYALEYALVVAIVALAVIGVIWLIGPQLAAVFSSVYDSVVITKEDLSCC